MSASVWESLVSRLLEIAVNSAQALLRIAVILAAAYLGAKLLHAGIQRLDSLLIRAASAADTSMDSVTKRIRTLTSVVWTIGFGLIWFIAVLISLGQVGVDLGPILAGAGIVGLAVGFGAQHLVRDLVTGFFLILENHIRVGDSAVINGTGGMVEAITFRTIVLRDLSGTVHVFPNGTINTLANMSKDWSAYVIDVPVAFKDDTDHVTEIMRNVAEELRAEPKYSAVMIEPIEILGVDAFTDVGVTIKARFKTKPSQQHNVGREYRRRLTKAFQAAGIEFSSQRRPNLA